MDLAYQNLDYLGPSVNSRDPHEPVNTMKSKDNPICAVQNTNSVSQVLRLCLVVVVAKVPARGVVY